MFLLWGPLEEEKSRKRKPIRKLSPSKKLASVHFSDQISYDDDSSSSLEEHYPASSWSTQEKRRGRIVKVQENAVWIECGLQEFWIHVSEGSTLPIRRWRLFGTKIV